MPIFKGNYKLIEQIGSGGFGTVYKVQTSLSPEFFVLKEIPLKNYIKKNAELIRNYEKEALEKIKHTNVISLKDYFEEKNCVYFVFPFYDGGSLHSLIKSESVLTEEDSLLYMIQMMNAFKYLKNNNILHRDMKPENVMLHDNKKTVILIDFGFAKQQIEETNTVLGTPGFGAPEILQNQKYCSKVDIFALGLTFYAMVAGEYLFKGSEKNILLEIRNKCGTNLQPKDNFKSGNKFSTEFLEMLRRMTEVKRNARVTIEECILMPFFDKMIKNLRRPLDDLSEKYLDEFLQNKATILFENKKCIKELVFDKKGNLGNENTKKALLLARELFFNKKQQAIFIVKTAKRISALRYLTSKVSTEDFLMASICLLGISMQILKNTIEIIKSKKNIPEVPDFQIFLKHTLSQKTLENLNQIFKKVESFYFSLKNKYDKVPKLSSQQIPAIHEFWEMKKNVINFFKTQREMLLSGSEVIKNEKILSAVFFDIYFCIHYEKNFRLQQDGMSFDWLKFEESYEDTEIRMKMFKYFHVVNSY